MQESSPNASLSKDSPIPTRKYPSLNPLLILTIAHFYIHSEIQENKEQTVEAMRNVHSVLNAFQEEF